MNTSPYQPEPVDPLDSLLREADAYIPDEGFTARVLQALPPRRARFPFRTVALSLALAIGCLVSLWALPPASFVLDFARLAFTNPQPGFLLALLPLLAALGSLGWTVFSLATDEG